MFRVEYITDCGSPSDNEFIGVYEDIKLAKNAKKLYIDERIGPKPLIEDYVDQSEFTFDLDDWEEEIERMKNCVIVEEFKNLF